MEPKPAQDRFIESYETLLKHEKLIKDLRNTIAGGHVKQTAIKEGLIRMDSEAHGIFQQGECYKDIRFKFAHAIVLEAFFKNDFGDGVEKEINEFMNFMHEVIRNTLRMVEFAFSVYVKRRGITPL